MLAIEDQIREAIQRLGSETEAPPHWAAVLWQLFEFLKDRRLTSLDEVTASDVVGFLFRPETNGGVSRNTIGDRGSVLYWLLKDRAGELGTPAARDVDVPDLWQPTRALMTTEMLDVQRVVRRGVSAARVALAQTAMSTGAVCDIPVGALDDPDDPREVRWPADDGTERVYQLTEWGRYAVRDRVRQVGGDPEASIAYEGRVAPGSAARRAASSKDLAKSLSRAGLDFDPSVKPKSISYWGGLVCRERGESPETVARLLGVRTENLPRFLL